jgi:histidinol-phosphate/aromatic aminotransferase/cobyric acid decarboxylase-like protein
LLTSPTIAKIISKLNEDGFIIRDRSNMYQLGNTARITVGREEQMEKVKNTIAEIVNKK